MLSRTCRAARNVAAPRKIRGFLTLSASQRSQKDAMSLSGLLRAVGDDPALRQALEHAALRAAGGGDLIAPPALRPVLAAALTGLADPSLADPSLADPSLADPSPADPSPADPS